MSDGNGGTAQATVTITVNAVNDTPVAVADAYSTNEDRTGEGRVGKEGTKEGRDRGGAEH